MSELHANTYESVYIGVAKEFPTAPRDSFLVVANRSDVDKGHGRDAVGAFLVQTDGSDPADVVDQRTAKIVDHFAVGALPQHVAPSWTCARCGSPTTPATA
jgi:hypothetical protein